MTEQNKNVRIYEELLHDWLWTNRREALMLGGAALAHLLGMFERAYADAEFQIEVSPQDQTRESHEDDATFNERSTETQPDQKIKESEEIGDQLGIAYRAPTCGLQNLTTMQFRATGTPEEAPGYLSVSEKSYFADNFSHSLSSSETLLSTASQKICDATNGSRYHFFNRPTVLPRGESVEANLKALLLGPASASLSAKLDAIASSYYLMRNYGPWDYKRTHGPEWDDAGNFNYAYIAAAIGIPEWAAERFAGYYKAHAEGSKYDPSYGHWFEVSPSSTHGISSRNQQQIQNAYDYFYQKELIDWLYGSSVQSQY